MKSFFSNTLRFSQEHNKVSVPRSDTKRKALPNVTKARFSSSSLVHKPRIPHDWLMNNPRSRSFKITAIRCCSSFNLDWSSAAGGSWNWSCSVNGILWCKWHASFFSFLWSRRRRWRCFLRMYCCICSSFSHRTSSFRFHCSDSPVPRPHMSTTRWY